MDYKVIFKEVGRKERTTHFYNAKSESQVIDTYGLNEPEIEYYKLEEIKYHENRKPSYL